MHEHNPLDDATEANLDERTPPAEPRFSFVEPKLIKRGKLQNITGFDGSIIPDEQQEK